MLINRIRLGALTAAKLEFSHRALQTLPAHKYPAAHAQMRDNVEELCQMAGILPWEGMQWRIEKNLLVLF